MHRRSSVLLLGVLACVAVVFGVRGWTSPTGPDGALNAAWRNANRAGSYAFETAIVQTVWPAPRVENVGLATTEDRYAMRGRANVPAKALELTIWQGDTPGSNAVEIQSVGGKVYGRQAGGDWQEQPSPASLFAPDNDLLSFLAGARNVRTLESAGGDSRFAFDIDGPALSANLRDRLERDLRAAGTLPAGATVGPLPQFAGVSGKGELLVDSSGLPVSIELVMQFPQASGDRVDARIRTQFTDWGTNVPLLSQASLDTVGRTIDRSPWLPTFTVSAAMVVFAVWVARRWRTPGVYRAVVLSVIPLTLIGPLLQANAITASAAAITQAASGGKVSSLILDPPGTEGAPEGRGPAAGSPPATQSIANASDVSRELLRICQANPADADGDGLCDAGEAQVGSDPARVDSDGDTLSDGIEALQIGTDPMAIDTDGDGISDNVEARGWTFQGQRWSTNPLKADTNNDGRVDGQECSILVNVRAGANRRLDTFTSDADKTKSAPCDDNDSDGIPDVWDEDDDGDGVPDAADLSPTTAINVPQTTKTFELGLTNASSSYPLLVEFQIRPVNGDHLQYAGNVLDWPANDREGQIQRVKSTTFGPTGKDANGDMRLIPMLEIEIPFEANRFGNLPKLASFTGSFAENNGLAVNQWLDGAQLDQFGIGVTKKNQRGDLTAYVPLTTVRDRVGSKAVAFSGTMLYQPRGNGFGPNHKVRLLWMVQSLVDRCDTTSAPANTTYDAWCADPSRWTSAGQVIQTYYDDWRLTGLTAREDRGTRVGVVFEDPDTLIQSGTYVPGSYIEQRLWLLARGLDANFINARGTSAREITINEIKRRFEKSGNSSVSETERWGFAATTFQVRTFDFSNYALIGSVPMTHTKNILDSVFKSGNASKVNAPTLLYLREETYRSAGLTTSRLVNQGSFTVDLNAANAPAMTIASMNWGSYQYNATSGWLPVSVEQYVAQVQARISRALQNDPALASDSRTLEGATYLATTYYLALTAGISQLAAIDGRPLSSGANQPDGNILTALKPAIVAGTGAATLVKEIASIVSADYASYLQSINKSAKPNGTWGKLSRTLTNSSTVSATDRLATVIVVGIVLTELGRRDVIAFGTDTKYWETANSALMAIVQAEAIFSASKALYQLPATVQGASRVAIIGDLTKTVPRSMKIGAALQIITTVAVASALYALEIKGLEPGALAFNRATGTFVATIIVAILLVAISLIPVVGPLITAIIGLIDILAMELCKYLGPPPSGGDWVCGGITGALTKAITELFFIGETPIVDLKRGDRLRFGGVNQTLPNPELGFVPGNAVNVSLVVSSTIYANTPSVWEGWVYLWQYGDRYLKQSDLDYKLSTTQTPNHSQLSSSGTKNYWQPATGGGDFTKAQRVAGTTTLPSPGLNQRVQLYLVEGQAIDAQECFAIPVPWYLIPVCYLKEQKDTTYIDLGDSFRFDVFPATIDGFYSLASRGNSSYALNWDARFPTLCDADGDGLRSLACGGNDPDDSKADSDEDGLTDYDEVLLGTDPVRNDTDGDGLTDYQELTFGTNVLKADSDADGLLDCEEVLHVRRAVDRFNRCKGIGNNEGADGQLAGGWEFVYGFSGQTPLATIVESNAGDFDSDGDSIPDPFEKVYGFNPQVAGRADILDIRTYFSERSDLRTQSDRYVVPGQDIYYSASVQNLLASRWANGLLSLDGTGFVTGDGSAPQQFELPPKYSWFSGGTFQVRPDIASTQTYTLTTRAGALVEDISALNDNRTIWLNFDEPAGQTNFIDKSMRGNPGTCTKGAPCPLAGEPGYSGRGVDFNAVPGSEVVLGDPAKLGMTAGYIAGGFTAMMWVKGTWTGKGRNSPLFGQRNLDYPGLEPCGRSTNYSPSYNRMGLYVETAYQNPRARFIYEGEQGKNLLCARTEMRDGEWNHIAVRFDRYSSLISIWVNGAKEDEQVARPNSIFGDLALGRSSFNYGAVAFVDTLSGQMDEFELFPRALTDEQIASRYKDPAIRLPFDGSTANTSPLRQAISVNNGGPGSYVDGRIDRAAQFPSGANSATTDKTLSTPTSASLDVSAGAFSHSFWIWPTDIATTHDCSAYAMPEEARQGITGPNAHDRGANAYPFVELVARSNADIGTSCTTAPRYNRAIRYGFGNYADSTGFVVPQMEWSHVAVTYVDRTYSVYLNGVLVKTSTVSDNANFKTKPDKMEYNSPSMLFGRAAPVRNAVTSIELYRDSNYGGGKLSTATSDISNAQTDPRGDIRGTTAIKVFGGGCIVIFTEVNFAGTSERICGDTGNVGGTFNDKIRSIRFERGTRAYEGRLDDFRFYRTSLSGDEVDSIYLNSLRATELRFDDSPGAAVFRDSSGNRRTVACGEQKCPTSGIPGRANQAVRFNGTTSQLEGRLATETVDNVTISAYVNWEGANGGRQIVAYNGNTGTNGYGLILDTDGTFQILVGGVAFLASTSRAIPGSWYHLVATRSAGSWRLYVNGASQTLNGNGAPVRPAGSLLVGADNAGGSPFKGLIDQVVVLNRGADDAFVRSLANELPVVQLRFDDPVGSSRFDDTSSRDNDATCTTSNCPQVGANGRVRTAAVFDGIDDAAVIAHNASLAVPAYTVGFWVKPSQALDRNQILVRKADAAGGNALFNLSITNQRKLNFQASNGSCTSGVNLTSTDPLPINVWTYVAASYDGTTARLFVNGLTNASAGGQAGVCASSQNIEIGGKASGSDRQVFAGQIDELQIYGKALLETDVEGNYLHQLAWIDTSATTRFIVDRDLPSVSLNLNIPYIKRATTVQCATATDPTSPIVAVEYQQTGDWQPAARDGALWCFTYVAPAQSPPNLLAIRARDSGGNVNSTIPQFTLDGTAPTATLSADNSFVPVDPSAGTLNLAGSVTDGQSGVQSIDITLIAPTGAAVGTSRRASVSGSAWSLPYPLPPNADGLYSVVGTVTDRALNSATVTIGTVRVDGSGAYADVTDNGPSFQKIASSNGILPVIKGTAIDVPYPTDPTLQLHFEETGGFRFFDGSPSRFRVSCNTGACPSFNNPSPFGKAIGFSGATNEYVFLKSPVDLGMVDPNRTTGHDFTIMAWINSSDLSTIRPIVTSNGEYSGSGAFDFGIAGGKLYIQNGVDLPQNEAFGATTLQANTWYHVAARYDTARREYTVFLNGKRDGVGSVPTPYSGRYGLLLGTGFPSRAFKGLIDEFAVFDRALNDDEMAAIASGVGSGVQSVEISLVHLKDANNPSAVNWVPVNIQPGSGFVNWSYQVPGGIEGPYQISLRTTDSLGRIRTLANRWSGDVDTLAPRVSVSSVSSGGTLTYTTVITDYNLTERNFVSPCGTDAASITSRTVFTAPWYSQVISNANATDRQALINKVSSFTSVCSTTNTQPQLIPVSAYKQYLSSATDVIVVGTLAYVADAGYGLLIIDISEPTLPRVLSRIAQAGIRKLLYKDSTIYAMTWNGIRAIDVLYQYRPLLGDYVSYPNGPRSDMAIVGNDLYVTVGGLYGGVFRYDIGNRLNPTYLYPPVFDVGDPAWVAVGGQYVYMVKNYGSNARIFFDGPGGPPPFDLPADELSTAFAIQNRTLPGPVVKTYAFIGMGAKGMRVLDITNPFNVVDPKLGGTLFDTAGSVIDIVLAGDLAYLADSNGGLRVVDITDPANPSDPGGVPTIFQPLTSDGSPANVRSAQTDGNRIYVAADTAGFQIVRNQVGSQAIVYDLSGNQGSQNVPFSLRSPGRRSMTTSGDLEMTIQAPPTVATTDSFDLSGSASSAITTTLTAITVMVDAATVFTQTWAPGTISSTNWLYNWTPAGEGPHTVVARADDALGRSASITRTVTLDTITPTLTIVPQLLNLDAVTARGSFIITGTATDANGINVVEATLDDTLLEVDYASGVWRADIPIDIQSPPNGITATLAVTATDRAGWNVSATTVITRDAVPPTVPNVGLSYLNGSAQRISVFPGGTISDTLNPTLFITWTAATDPSGVNGYFAGWSANPSPTITEALALQSYTPAQFEHSQAGSEAQRLYAHVVSRDGLGNARITTVGPVFVDFRLTPDYVALTSDPYRGWQNGCTLIGVDSRLSRSASGLASNAQPQQLYATWNAMTLRLSWLGANWDSEGDLLIFLAGPGAATQTAYNPYPLARQLTLPVAVNTAIWVHDSGSASLFRWNGSAWVAGAGLTSVISPNIASRPTELAVPFSSIGIGAPNGVQLGLLAYATDDNSANIWAAIPARNVVNSARVTDPQTAQNRVSGGYGLPLRAATLTLGDNACPNDGTFTAAEMTLGVGAVNPALNVTVEEDGWVTTRGNLNQQLVGAGEAVAYRVEYSNVGSAPAMNATVVITGNQITLAGGTPVGPYLSRFTVNLGTVAAGATGVITVNGTISIDPNSTLVAPLSPPIGGVVRIQASVSHDGSALVGAPVQTQEVFQRVDVSPPSYVEILSPRTIVGLGNALVEGIVHDESSVPSLALEVQAPDGGVSTIACPNPTPDAHRWSCAWPVGGSPSATDVYQLRARATDRYGLVSGWSPWVAVVVDTQSPQLSLDGRSRSAVDSGLVSGDTTEVSGLLTDNRTASRIDVCRGSDCQSFSVTANVTTTLPASQIAFNDDPTPTAIGAATPCAAPVVRTFTVNEPIQVARVRLGFAADLANRANLRVTLRSPQGTLVQLTQGGAAAANIDVLWDDRTIERLATDSMAHATGTPYFDANRRPDGLLAAFSGEQGQGSWTLTICDSGSPGVNGTYLRSRLEIDRDVAPLPTQASWSYPIATAGSADGVADSFTVTGVDSFGNRSEPLTVSFSRDNVAPVVSVTSVVSDIARPGDTPVVILGGSASDGGGIKSVYLAVESPSGERSFQQVDSAGATAGNINRQATSSWTFSLVPTEAGRYSVTVYVIDSAGNETLSGPYAITVAPAAKPTITSVYVPHAIAGGGVFGTTYIHIPLIAVDGRGLVEERAP